MVQELHDHIENGPEELDLLDKQGGNDQNTANSGQRDLFSAPAPANDFTAVPLSEVITNQRIVSLLGEVDVRTLGDLTEWQKKHGEMWYHEIKGCGPGTAAVISEECMTFFAQHPEYCESSQSADPPAEDADEAPETTEATAA